MEAERRKFCGDRTTMTGDELRAMDPSSRMEANAKPYPASRAAPKASPGRVKTPHRGRKPKSQAAPYTRQRGNSATKVDPVDIKEEDVYLPKPKSRRSK
ncbi:hypothetical protein OF83DRAFT_1155270 [Amylostereum chailletii]|nr:hypothetical protein OF83DRAFT_1155270 [Amylostereum chailletii]